MWSDMPSELLDEVADRLDVAVSDTRHLRSVCHSWWSAIHLRPLPGSQLYAFPLLIHDDYQLPNFNHNNRHTDNNFDQQIIQLAQQTIFHLFPLESQPLEGASRSTSTSGWIIKTEEHRPGAFHLFNSFSRNTNCQYHHNCSNVKSDEGKEHYNSQNPIFKLDITNVKIQVLGSEYVLRSLHKNGKNMQELLDMEHQKVALIMQPSHNNKSHPQHQQCVDYTILSTHDTGKLLMYQKPLKKWIFLEDFTQLGYDDRSIFVNDWSLHYVDVAEYDGIFYAVTDSGRTVAIRVSPTIEDSTPQVTITLLTMSIIGGDKKILVKSADDLLLIDIYTSSPGVDLLNVVAIEVFKLDTKGGKWVLVNNLGEHILFLSNRSSFSAPAMSGCKPNFIYFHFKNSTQDCHQCVWTSSHEIGVFDFEKGIFGSFEEHLQDLHILSWPPPAWVSLSP